MLMWPCLRLSGEKHLVSGLTCCAKSGFVAFGTDAGMVLTAFRNHVGDKHVADILFYASHTSHGGGPPSATYRARFVCYDGAASGRAKPSWAKYRPDTTANDQKWLSFYSVSNLRLLDRPIILSSLTKLNNRGRLARNFIPIGPIIIDTPF